MSKIIIPANYTPALNLYDTQRAIGTVKRLFADTLCATLNLYRVSAPLFVEASTGLNDDLNGVERKVTFDTKDSGIEVQVVQSLAKWKQMCIRDRRKRSFLPTTPISSHRSPEKGALRL